LLRPARLQPASHVGHAHVIAPYVTASRLEGSLGANIIASRVRLSLLALLPSMEPLLTSSRLGNDEATLKGSGSREAADVSRGFKSRLPDFRF
jgi:hypothetical protein